MSTRIRQTRGTSWRDPRVPGTRHWASTSVSFGLSDWMLGAALWYLVILPFFVFPLWLGIESWVLVISVLAVLLRWALEPETPQMFHVELCRTWWFWYLDWRP